MRRRGGSLQRRSRASQRRDDAASRVVVGEDRGLRPLRQRLLAVRRRQDLDHAPQRVIRDYDKRSLAPERADQRQPALRSTWNLIPGWERCSLIASQTGLALTLKKYRQYDGDKRSNGMVDAVDNPRL